MAEKFAAAFHGFIRPRPAVKRSPDAALRYLNATLVDLASPFAAWLAEAVPAMGGESYEPRPRIVAEAEAEFARSVGGQACPIPHGVENERGEIEPLTEWTPSLDGLRPLSACPGCGAAV